jgi:hypothetical protein
MAIVGKEETMTVEKLTNLVPGKILSEDVFNFQGLLLLKKDTYLTEKNLRMLKSWGVFEVRIIGEDGQAPPDGPRDQGSDANRDIEAEIKEKFISDTDNPVMKEIMSVAFALLEKRRSGNGKQF